MSNVYIIPDNFIEGGRVLGMFRTRNLIEAILIGGGIGIPLWCLPPYPSFQIKLMVVLCCVAPVFLVSLMGVNGDSFIQFLQQYLKWRKNRRIMLYNGAVRTREIRAADVMMSQELAKDKLVDAIENWQDNRKKKNENSSFIEGRDFIFIDDEEAYSSYTSAENKLLGNTGTEKIKKHRKRRKERKDSSSPTASPFQDEVGDTFVIANSEPDNDTIIIDGEVMSIE